MTMWVCRWVGVKQHSGGDKLRKAIARWIYNVDGDTILQGHTKISLLLSNSTRERDRQTETDKQIELLRERERERERAREVKKAVVAR
jgi:hypothetical protein